MLTIMFRDGSSRTWKKDTYTDYEVTNGLFVVEKGMQWVGFYQLADIKYMECVDD